MWNRHESEIYTNQLGGAAYAGKQPKNYVWLDAKVTYHTSQSAPGLTGATDFVRTVEIEWGEAKLKGNAFVKFGASNPVAYDVAAPTAADLKP
jgi:hypothetical protein